MLARDEDAKGQWRHTRVILAHVVSQRPDLQRLRHREPETEAGTHVELPNCGTTHDRNLKAAINLRNLIMPVGRSRDGPGQEAMVLQQRDLQRPRDREPGNGGGSSPRVAAGITGS